MDLPTKEDVAETAERVRRAILTLCALPDPENRWLRPSNTTVEVIREIAEAYGYSEVRLPRFQPTAHDVDDMLVVFAWLTWLKNQNNGDRDFKIVWAKAFRTPTWKLAQQYGRSDRTIQRWHDGAITSIHTRFCVDRRAA